MSCRLPDEKSNLLTHASPAELIRARFVAFAEGDFGFIFDSYHPDSNFRRQFEDRDAYTAYGRSNLSADFLIRECRILRERINGDLARVILYVDTLFRGAGAESFELALLLLTPDGWRYHSGQKMLRGEFEGEIGDIDWKDFERVKDKVFF